MADDTKLAQYQRLEPRVRPDGHGGFLDEALAATVADPLFLLARQWQLAEFQGEDGGSPIASRLTVEKAPISRFRPGDDGDPVTLPTGHPLEFVVEHGADPGLTLRDRARGGLHFLTILGEVRDGVIDAVLKKCALDDPEAVKVHERDAPGLALQRLLVLRAPDAVQLAEHLRTGWQPSDLDQSETQAFQEASQRWLTWFAAEHPASGASCWVTERLEHRFSLGAAFPDEQVVLTAPEFGGGRIETYHLDADLRPERTLGAVPTATEPVTQTKLATRVSYPGMPADRWWEFEDDTVNLGAISAGPADLARLLLISFANVYGNDWWSVPVDLKVGSVYRIKSEGLTVTDTFGEELKIVVRSHVRRRDPVGRPQQR
jgi:hypothetical protein